jgi:hypothetical protein
MRDARQEGASALLASCRGGHLDVVQWLVMDCGVDVKSKVHICTVQHPLAVWLTCVRACCVSQRGSGAVLAACGAGRLDVVKWLVSEGRVKLKQFWSRVCRASLALLVLLSFVRSMMRL